MLLLLLLLQPPPTPTPTPTLPPVEQLPGVDGVLMLPSVRQKERGRERELRLMIAIQSVISFIHRLRQTSD